MRPSILDPLFAPLTTLGGVGPKLKPLFDRLLDRQDARVVDLLLHLPTGGIDRRLRPKVADAPFDQVVTLEVVVEDHRPPPPGRSNAPFRVIVADETGDLALVFFRLHKRQVEGMLPLGAKRIISGRLELFDGVRQMVHPDRVLAPEQATGLPAVEPIYPLTEGLAPRLLHRTARAAVARLPALPEWQDAAFLARNRWPTLAEALRTLHEPPDPEALAEDSPALARLAYDELLANQLALVLIREQHKRRAGRSLAGDGTLRAKVLAALPFALTDGQRQALTEIERDMAAPEPMLRLLQGDVGSGKTVVALLAMLTAVEAGAQAALMAPTEVLARQHAEGLAPLCAAAGVSLLLLTGRDRPAERRAKLAALADGSAAIAVGTHALFQEQVRFRDLALTVVDEQHRFGVQQRLALSAKGRAGDLLVMTATPIPRTLVLTAFGDMDVSQLTQKPAGRKPIITRAVPLERMGDVLDGLARALKEGAQAYWVCPLVAESEELEDVAAATDRHEALLARFGPSVGLVHGQMPGPEKDAALAAFAAGETAILVATTVIEVGVNVPNATIMVIEHAERFGLAQLHQLRGRVGRGDKRSSCILLYRAPLGEVAQQRLAMLRETEDGFLLAEADLKLRGEGDVLGTRQAGQAGFRVARLGVHGHLLPVARDDVKLLLSRDPTLSSERGAALKVLLYLFERDAAVRLLRAG
jgi:ATP-dependent DNA helicase RecG